MIELMTWRLVAANWRRAGRGSDGRDLPRLGWAWWGSEGLGGTVADGHRWADGLGRGAPPRPGLHPLLLHFRAMLEFLHNLNHFLLAATTIGASLDKRSPKDKFSHNPQSLVAVQTLLTAISKIVRVFKKLRAHISLRQTILGKS